MNSLVILISQVIELFIWLLIIQAILSWLVAFGIVNTNNNLVSMVGNFLYKITMVIKASMYGMAAKYAIPSFKLSAAC